jgi:hypothetical protein
MKRKIFMGAMLALIGFFALSTTVMAGSYAGKYCFKYDSFADTWIWYVDAVGNAYQVTGIDTAYTPDASLNGGGAITAGILYITMDERIAIPGVVGQASFAVHNIKLNMATLVGTDYLSWFDFNGTKTISYPAGLVFRPVVCPAEDAPGYQEWDGPRTADVK